MISTTPFRRLLSTARTSTLSASTLPHPCRVVLPHPASMELHHLHGSTASHTLRPAVVVIQEWWGINDQILEHAQRVANSTGAIAVVPDLYNGIVTADKEEAAHLMGNLDWPKALGELQAVVQTLQRPTEPGMEVYKDRKVASVGFCMGGALSLAITARMAELNKPLNACVAFYGTPSNSLIDISEIPATTPVQAHFGELDEYVGFADLKTAHALAKDWDLTVKMLGGSHAHGFHSLESNVYVHEGMGHAFMNEKSPAVKVEVEKTWEKVFKFLVEHLKTV
ncbi:hypothetical protein HDU98_005191 [Podochytrium sp. JEL0797]|nr:hypothetical protein HDU98_005191 [Podochytrium sp. JEL0797]